MKERLISITDRKSRLVALADAQRLQLQACFAAWERPAKVVGQVNSFVRNPLVIAAFGLLMAKMPWRRAIKVSRWAYKGWKVVKLLQLFRRFAF